MVCQEENYIFLGEFTCNISFVGKYQKSSWTCAKKKTKQNNLFGMDGISLFDLSDLPINSFYN